MSVPAAELPEEPEAAVAAVFGPRAAVARAFVVHLASSAVERGLIGPREVPRLWERHVLNCAVVHELVPDGADVVDVGSGAGLPGLAVAIARPDLRVTLVEPLQRRVTWLEEVVADLGLDGVTVVRARAEELRAKVAAEVVTARAVAPLPSLAQLCLPLVRPGGRFVAVKGRSAAEELEAAHSDLCALGATGGRVLTLGAGVLGEPTTVVEIGAGEAPARSVARRRRAR